MEILRSPGRVGTCGRPPFSGNFVTAIFSFARTMGAAWKPICLVSHMPDHPQTDGARECRFLPDRIATERLVLRLPRMTDAKRVFDYARDPEVTRYSSFRPLKAIQQAEEFLEQRVLAGW